MSETPGDGQNLGYGSFEARKANNRAHRLGAVANFVHRLYWRINVVVNCFQIY